MSNDSVKNSYDLISQKYSATRDTFISLPYLEEYVSHLEPGDAILDVGCGAGIPVDDYLVKKGFGVTGIDISDKQIDVARHNVPQALFEVKDMTTFRDYEYCVNGIVSFYAIFHTPREQHANLFKKFATFMPKGGILFVTMGAGDNPGAEEEFHSVPLFYSFYPPEKNVQLIESAGFTIINNEIDASGGEKHQIILAKI